MATESTPLSNQSGLVVNPPSLSFGTIEQGVSKSESLTITNLRSYPLNWEISSGSEVWFSLSELSGILNSNGQITVYVTVNTGILSPGTYTSNIILTFRSTVLQEPVVFQVPVSVEVAQPSSTGSIGLDESKDITNQSPDASQVPRDPNAAQSSRPDSSTEADASKLVQALIESDAVQEQATADMPVQSVDKDKLGFKDYVHAFRDFIASQDTSTPLTVGIYGTWGSGKSSLMRMIKNELDPPLNFWSWLWLKSLWMKWFRSYLGTLDLWLSAKLQLWHDDRHGRAQKYRDTVANQSNIAKSQSSATSNQGNQLNNNTNYGGQDIANTSAAQNSTDSNQSGQTKNVASNKADPTQNAHSSPPNISASTSNGRARSSQHSHDDSQIPDKIGGPRRFEEIRKSLSYTPESEKIHRLPPPLYRINSFQSHYQKIVDATKLPEIRAGLSYDPSATDKRLDDLIDKDERYWAKIAAAHCPMVPLTHPTIWFNAWKFDQEEQLWAALALEVMNQIKQKYGKVGRFFFWARLTWKRSSHLAAFWSIIWRLVLPIVLLVITVIYTLYLTSITNATASSHIYDFLGVFSPKGPYAAVMPLILFAGAIFSGIPAVKIIKDPFQISVKDILDKPNYKDKVGFIGEFDKDFARIVSVATRRQFGWKPRKLVIFIDDLDRCEPPKAADIIEGINLFLDSDRCVFVLGMDPNAVAASIENKYKELFEKMRRENTAVVSPGRLFLDKIIQVPFYVPLATEDEITKLISSIMLPKVFLFQTASIPRSNGNRTDQQAGIDQAITITPPMPSEPTQLDRASYKHDDIQQAIKEGAKFLSENPRQVKKYMNLFRFYVYIADARGLLRFREEGTDKLGLTLNRLAVWIAWSVRWPEIAKPLSEEVQTAELRDYLVLISKVLTKDGCWCSTADAVKEEPWFGNSTLFPIEDYELRKYRDPVYAKLIKRISQIRETEQDAPSHWGYLPWEWWLLDSDFRKSIKEMESFWKPPQEGEDDWLLTVLTWTRITFSARTTTNTSI
jgi:hypothetical protein